MCASDRRRMEPADCRGGQSEASGHRGDNVRAGSRLGRAEPPQVSQGPGRTYLRVLAENVRGVVRGKLVVAG
jgi:hypothetical protein